MIKRFAFSLLFLSTIVYGSLFLMAKHYGTGFFDEVSIQLNRISATINHKPEIDQSKFILKAIIDNEHPPAGWSDIITHNRQKNDSELFYHYKIWTIIIKLNINDINDSYPIFHFFKDNINFITMRYGKTKPIIQFPFLKDKAGNLLTGLFFPINEEPVSADYNMDNIVNHEDVLLARKAEETVL